MIVCSDIIWIYMLGFVSVCVCICCVLDDIEHLQLCIVEPQAFIQNFCNIYYCMEYENKCIRKIMMYNRFQRHYVQSCTIALAMSAL